MTSRIRSVSLIVALTLTAAACGSSDSDSSADAAADTSDVASTEAPAGDTAGDAGDPAGDTCTAERVGGEITFGTYTATSGFDPAQINGYGGTSAIENAAVYDTLVRYDEATATYVPHMAESIEANEDDSVWTLTLREGVTFSNGDAVDAAAVKASIERHIADDSTSALRGLLASSLASIDVVDDSTVTFTLLEPWATFPYALSRTPGMITNPAVVAEVGAEGLNLDPVGAGSGPYTVARFVPGDEVVLEAREDYWGGPVCIETIKVVWVPGAQPTWEAFQNGDLQAAFSRDAAVATDATAAGVAAFTFLNGAGGAVMINNENEALSDPRLRKAIQLSTDPDLFNERLNEGKGRPTSALVPTESRLYSDGVAGLAYDLDAAEALVAEVAAEGTWDGSVDVLCHSARPSFAVLMEAQLNAVGIEANIDTDGDINSMLKAVYVDREYGILCWGFQIDDVFPYNGLVQFTTGHPTNVTGYSNPDMDAAIESLKTAATLEEQQALIVEIQEIWNETVPSMVYDTIAETVVLDQSIHGVVSNTASVVLFSDAYLAD